MLAKVLASGGAKKFYFAYGTGKRKDGKGDGELAVSGTKPKKTAIEGELSDCKQVLEGVCWTGKGPNDAQTVYFQGKSTKLSATVVAKMVLTVKRVSGRQYDFQVPSPEEEARVANLKEGEGDEIPVAPPAPPAPPDGKAPNLEARLKALLVRQKVLLDKDLSLKEKLLPFYQQAWALMKSGKPGAAEALDKFEAALNAVSLAATQETPPTSKSGDKPLSGSLESMTYQRVLAALMPRYDQARVINAELVRQMEKIEALAKANRYADALEILDQLEIDVDRTLASVPKPAATGDQFKARLKALLPKYNAAIKEDPALLAQLRPLMGQVIALGNANQFEQALPFLIQVEKALGVAKPLDKADPAASGMQRLNGLMPAIKAALSAGGPNVARIQALVSAAGGLLKNKDAAQANKVLDELEPLLKPVAGTGAPAQDVVTGEQFKARLKALLPAYNAAIKEDPALLAQLKPLMGQVIAQGNANQFTQALPLLIQIEKALAAARPRTAGDGATSKSQQTPAKPVSLVQLQQCRLAWGAAIKKIEADLSKLQQATKAAYKHNPPQQAFIAKAIDGLVAKLEGHYESLSDKLDEALNAPTEEKRNPFHQQAVQMIQQFRTYVDSDPVIGELDENGLVPLQVQKTLSSVLPLLAAKLGG
jgi:ubiquinone biosynthesis protein UbiJ